VKKYSATLLVAIIAISILTAAGAVAVASAIDNISSTSSYTFTPSTVPQNVSMQFSTPQPLTGVPPVDSWVITGNHATSTQFYINLNGAPAGAYQAVQNALNTWDTVIPGMFKPLIVDNAATGGQLDGKDVISWGSCANGATAQTYLWPGTQERDIVFSTATQWSVAPSVTYHSYDVQNIATHELGHVIGLGDIYREDFNYVTMFGYAPKGETSKDVLSPSDIYGAQQIYGVAA
jgi:hypothetical protein